MTDGHYTDADRRAHDALMNDVMPDDTRLYDCPRDYVQDFDRGMLARITSPEKGRAWVFIFPIVAIICVAVAVVLGMRL